MKLICKLTGVIVDASEDTAEKLLKGCFEPYIEAPQAKKPAVKRAPRKKE